MYTPPYASLRCSLFVKPCCVCRLLRRLQHYWTQGGGYPTAHGGLTDADPIRQAVWDQYDPSLGDAGPGRPRYWCVGVRA